ncbi:unnamed protein product [Musa hybrid cultivar]
MHSPDWTSLPPDLLAKISEEFPIPHRARIRATCKDWHSAMVPVISPSPWLFVPDDDGEQHNSTFFSLPDNCSFTYPPLPELCGMTCVGSHAGWFVITDRKRKVSLLIRLRGIISASLPTSPDGTSTELTSKNSNLSALERLSSPQTLLSITMLPWLSIDLQIGSSPTRSRAMTSGIFLKRH